MSYKGIKFKCRVARLSTIFVKKTSYNSCLQDLRQKKASEKDCDGIIKDAAFPEKGVREKNKRERERAINCAKEMSKKSESESEREREREREFEVELSSKQLE